MFLRSARFLFFDSDCMFSPVQIGYTFVDLRLAGEELNTENVITMHIYPIFTRKQNLYNLLIA